MIGYPNIYIVAWVPNILWKQQLNVCFAKAKITQNGDSERQRKEEQFSVSNVTIAKRDLQMMKGFIK